MSIETTHRKGALRRFQAWLRDEPTRTDPIIPPAFGGIPPSYAIPEMEMISLPARERDAGGGGIVASARKLTNADVEGRNKAAQGGAATDVAAWQVEAWELLDLIGEQRFLVHTLASRMSQAALYVGKASPEDAPDAKPEHVEDEELQGILDAIGDGIAGRQQLIKRAGVNILVAGEVWLAGIPPRYIAGTREHEAAKVRQQGATTLVDRAEEQDTDDVLALTWRMLSTSEVNVDQEKVTLRLEDGTKVEAAADDLYMIRIWQPHPRQAWEADSPTRASLPVLRELLGLTQHVSAQVDSRLAGAGLLAVSSDVSAALKRAVGLDESDPSDPLLEALTLAMETAISDRSSASALVPLTVTVPGDPSKAFHHLSFAVPLDKEARSLRDEAIRRLALGQDAPPELLLGTGGMNHWGAWLVQEDVVSTHLEPYLALICDALTTQYLRPLLRQMGYTDDQADEFVVWYDVDHLISRPNRTQDAKDNHDKGVISDKALREATGFEESDAPEVVEAVTDPAVELALGMIAQAPSLVQSVGIPQLVEQIRAVLDGAEAPAPPTEEEPASDDAPAGAIPDTLGDPAPAGTPANPDGGPR